MKLALAQMSMRNNFNENYKTSQLMIQNAVGNQLLAFPFLQLTPYFPQLPDLKADSALSRENDARMVGISYQAKKNNMYIASSVYYEMNHKKYATGLLFDRQGKIQQTARQIHVYNETQAYEANYFDPSTTGYVVHKTNFGNIGICVNKDIHFSESVRILALNGADMVLVPSAIHSKEMLDLTICELRSYAYENHLYIAMINRVGKEGKLQFVGNSTVVDPEGKIILQADDTQQLLAIDVDLSKVKEKQLPLLARRKEDQYSQLFKQKEEN